MKTSVNANNAKGVRSGFSMIELVFVIVILGVLAAVAVPRFVATRTDAQIATARSDMASAQKAIVAKVFADNIDATQASAPDPNKAVSGQQYNWASWGEWIINISGLDGSRWSSNGGTGAGIAKGAVTTKPVDTVQAIGNVKGGKKGGCGGMLGINPDNAMLVFAPNNIGGDNFEEKSSNFCYGLKKSYESSGGPGNKLIPLGSSGTVEF